MGQGRSKSSEGVKHAHVTFRASHDSLRFVLPLAVLSCLEALISDEDHRHPSERRLQLRNAAAAVRRAYRLPLHADFRELHAELEESEDAT